MKIAKKAIDCRCTILKGTTIGDNSVAASGTPRTGIFPDKSLIIGNQIKAIDNTGGHK